jgi:hypothetical protein
MMEEKVVKAEEGTSVDLRNSHHSISHTSTSSGLLSDLIVDTSLRRWEYRIPHVFLQSPVFIIYHEMSVPLVT